MIHLWQIKVLGNHILPQLYNLVSKPCTHAAPVPQASWLSPGVRGEVTEVPTPPHCWCGLKNCWDFRVLHLVMCYHSDGTIQTELSPEMLFTPN